MTVIASAIAASVGTAVLGALPAGVAGAITGAGIGAGTVGAITIGGAAAGIGGTAAASAADANKAKQADQRQGAANAAVAGTAPAGASNLYAAAPAAATTPIASGEQKLFATGGITALAKGGHGVRLEDSDYIIPADVVSALGNGSSRAGARYLQEQLSRLNSVGGVGALPPAKQLRATRAAKQKHKA